MIAITILVCCVGAAGAFWAFYFSQKKKPYAADVPLTFKNDNVVPGQTPGATDGGGQPWYMQKKGKASGNAADQPREVESGLSDLQQTPSEMMRDFETTEAERQRALDADRE